MAEALSVGRVPRAAWVCACVVLAAPQSLHAQEETPTPTLLPDFTLEPQMPDGEPLPLLPPGAVEIPEPPAEPPVNALTERWQDSDKQTQMAMRGGFGICSAATLPLRLIPQVGLLISMGIEWVCILPAAVTVDYVQRAHGTRRSFLWPSLTALAVTKVWRDFTQLPGLLNLLALTTGVTLATVGALVVGVVAVTVAVVAPFAPGALLAGWLPVAAGWLPILVAGALSYSALLFLVMEWLRDSLGDVLFLGVYGLLSGQWTSPEAQWREQHKEWVRPKLNAAERTWLLASVAAGSTPEFRVWHIVPVVGPAIKAWDRHKMLKLNVHRVARDDLREPEHDHELVDVAIVTLCALEGAVGVLAHIATALSVGLFSVGLAAGAVQSIPRFQGPLTTLVAGSAGVMATAAAVVALFLVVLRDAPNALKPVVIPAAYDLWPPHGFLPERE